MTSSKKDRLQRRKTLELQAERERYELVYQLSGVMEQFTPKSSSPILGFSKIGMIKFVVGLLFPNKIALVFKWLGNGLKIWQVVNQIRENAPDPVSLPVIPTGRLRRI
ncbi:MAG: hypothetical protein A2Z96_04590 [Spirochaetes bacterium GWB1_48_6]|nr:MAG: hypothetical protein A2Z96_04590 [Spirochaetes bacterium GWB1_48_6]